MLDKIIRGIDRVTAWSEVIIYVLIFMCLLIVYHVIARYALGITTAWCSDAEYMLMLVVMAIPLGYGVLKGVHVRIDVISRRYPARVQQALWVANYLVLVIPLALILIVYGWVFAMKAWEMREVTVGAAHLLAYPVKFFLPLGGLLLLLQAVARLAGHVRLLLKKEGKP